MQDVIDEKQQPTTNETSLIVIEQKENKNKKKIIKLILKGTFIILFPIIMLLAMENLNEMDANAFIESQKIMSNTNNLPSFFHGLSISIGLIWDYYIGRKYVSLLIIIALYTGSYAIFGKAKRAMIITAILVFLVAITNNILVQIRGTSLTPTDLYSIGMVTKMKDGIKITIPYQVYISVGIIILWIFLFSRIKTELKLSKLKSSILRGSSFLWCTMFFALFFTTNVFSLFVIYNTRDFYKTFGVTGGFLTLVKEMNLEKPEGYSIDAIKIGLEKYEKTVEVSNQESKDQEKNTERPNIIVIMNESLTDLEELFNIKTTEDNMPFIHSLSENTIKGNVHSSSLGGKTANCEWEFLTGNTTRFIPVGAVPYQMYIKKETISAVDKLKDNGYTTVAFHPYNPEGYNRNLVYELMGFNDFKFRKDMENLNYIKYNDYADDLSTYKNIVKLFEEKEKGKKIFNFTVTMQNHMSYDDRNFENNVFLEDFDKEEKFCVNQYLSLVKMSDDAFKYLVEYFEKYDEPTIIAMFGDHQPNLVEEYPDVFGKGTEEHDENKYITPFILWANYDIEEKNIGDISMNYLSNVIFDVAGLEKTEYMKYLTELSKKYPVITTNVYKDENGNLHAFEDDPEDFKLYRYIQYNNVADSEKIEELYK